MVKTNDLEKTIYDQKIFDFYNNCIKFEKEETIDFIDELFFGRILLFTYKFDRALKFFQFGKNSDLFRTMLEIKEIIDEKETVPFINNIVIDETIQLNLSKDLWSKSFLKDLESYDESWNLDYFFVKFKAFVRDLYTKLQHYSRYFTISGCSVFLYRVIIVNEIDDFINYSVIPCFTSFSICLSSCLITFGMNNYMHNELYGCSLVIMRIKVKENTFCLPTSLCSLQEEGEILLPPGVFIGFLEIKEQKSTKIIEITKNHKVHPETKDQLNNFLMNVKCYWAEDFNFE